MLTTAIQDNSRLYSVYAVRLILQQQLSFLSKSLRVCWCSRSPVHRSFKTRGSSTCRNHVVSCDHGSSDQASHNSVCLLKILTHLRRRQIQATVSRAASSRIVAVNPVSVATKTYPVFLAAVGGVISPTESVPRPPLSPATNDD